MTLQHDHSLAVVGSSAGVEAPSRLHLMRSSVFWTELVTEVDPEDGSCWSLKFCQHIRTLDLCVCVSVARSVALRTVQILRAGPEGEAASHAALPRLVRQGQLRTYCTGVLCVHTVCTLCLRRPQFLLLLLSGEEEEEEEPAAHRK